METDEGVEMGSVTESHADEEVLLNEGRGVMRMFDLGMFAVLIEMWRCDEKKIEEIAGFDAMVFTTLLWFQCKLFLALLPIGCFVLAPLYMAGGKMSNDFLHDVALSNVDSNDTWITYFTLVVALGIHLVSTWFLSKMYQRLSVKADKFKARATESHCTVMITEIEERLMHKDKLDFFLDRLYPGEVCNVDFCKDLTGVQKVWKTFENAKRQRELCEQSKNKTLGWCCLKKNLTYLQKVEKDARDVFYEIDIDSVPNIPVAIVQFESVQTAASCANSVLVPGGRSMRVLAVPEYADQIMWTNLSEKILKKQVGRIVGIVFYILVIIFYSPLMVFVQGIANLENLANMSSVFAIFLNISPYLKSLLQGFLPAILFSIFFTILPMYLGILSSLCKMPFKTDEASLTLARYADCLVGMGLLVSVFASGILSSIDALNQLSPSELWTQLGKQVPAQSIFFITYVITACFISMAMSMAMVVPFILNVIGWYAPTTFDYGTAYGINIMMFTICVTYAVVSPVILIWGSAYFVVAYFTFTYQLIYVYKRSNDTGGASFPAIYGRLNNGMIIGQLVIIAMFVLVKAMIPAAIFLCAPIYTLSTKSYAKRYGYYFCQTCVNTANEEGVGKMNIVTKGDNNFIAPAVKALQTGPLWKAKMDEEKEKGYQKQNNITTEGSAGKNGSNNASSASNVKHAHEKDLKNIDVQPLSTTL